MFGFFYILVVMGVTMAGFSEFSENPAIVTPITTHIMLFIYAYYMIQTSKDCFNEVIIKSLHMVLKGLLKHNTCGTIVYWFYCP